jgi:DNA-binding NarL/FixJ family response regulator
MRTAARGRVPSVARMSARRRRGGVIDAPGGTRSAPGTVTVVVSDPHPGPRAALIAALDSQAGIAVVGSANRLEDAVATIRRRRPDVVLMDLALAGDRGLAGLRELAAVRRSTAVLVIGVVEDVAGTRQVMRAGAAGRVMKDAPVPELAAAVRSAGAQGRRLRVVPGAS